MQMPEIGRTGNDSIYMFDHRSMRYIKWILGLHQKLLKAADFYTNARDWQNRSRLDFISWWPFCWSRDWITSSCFCCYEPSLILPQIIHFLGKNFPPHSVLWEKQTYYCQRDNIRLPDKGTTNFNFLLPFRWWFSFKQKKDRTAAPKLLLLPSHNL